MTTITVDSPTRSCTPHRDSLIKKAFIWGFYRNSSLRPTILKAYMKASGVRNWPAIPTHMSERELALLFAIAGTVEKGATLIEFGSYYGKSSTVLAAACRRRGGHLYCVDSWMNDTMPEGQMDVFPAFERAIGSLKGTVTPLRQRTTAVHSGQIAQRAALGFIDADHSYEGVCGDLQCMIPLLADEAYLLMHDTNSFSGVSRAVGELLASGEWKLIHLVDSLACLRRAQWEVKPWVNHD